MLNNLEEEPLLFYKGYYSNIQFEEDIIYGHVLFINDSIFWQAEHFEDVLNEFRSTVEDYLDTCKSLGKEPNKTNFNISFNRKELENMDL